MTRKDYVKFAEAFRLNKPYKDHTAMNAQHDRLLNAIADVFAADNPRFDRERFYRACEPQKEEKL